MGIVNIDDPEYVKLYKSYDSGLTIRFYHKVFKYRFVVPIFKLLSKDASIMDVGCARGKFLFDMRQKYGFHNLSGLDLAFIDTALVPGKDANFFQASITDKDFKLTKEMAVGTPPEDIPLSYDAVFVQNMLHHLPIESLPDVARNIASLCKPGGYLFIYDVNRKTLVGRFFYHVFLRLFPAYYAAAMRENPEQYAFCDVWPDFYVSLEKSGLECIKRSEWSFYKSLVFKKK